MLPNTTSEREKFELDSVVQQWKVYAEALAERVTKYEALRKYDFKTRKYNEPQAEHPRKKKRREDDVQWQTIPAETTRTPESFWRPQPEPTRTSGCTCCSGDQQVLGLTRAAVYAFNVLNTQAEAAQPYDPYSRVRKWLDATSVWWHKAEADTDNTTEKVDQDNNVVPFAWINWDTRRAL